jgi:hypothetical protein
MIYSGVESLLCECIYDRKRTFLPFWVMKLLELKKTSLTHFCQIMWSLVLVSKLMTTT